MDKKIFVSIASYCDELLFFTINSCLSRAKYKESITIAVVDQNTGSQKDKLKEIRHSDKVKYVYINCLETQGVSWARNIAFSLWDGEDYLLQIDSHTHFEEGWDESLLQQYSQIIKLSDKPVITTYPYGFIVDGDGVPAYHVPSGDSVLAIKTVSEKSLSEHSAVLSFQAVGVKSKKPVLGFHIAAGFIFTSGKFIEEVPYDPFLYFHGEEQSLSIRSYTRGWDVYHPTWIPLYHCYKQSNVNYKNTHWDKDVRDQRLMSPAYLESRSKNRLNRLLYGDGLEGSAYSLGIERTLDDFAKLSGIDYKARVIDFSFPFDYEAD